MPTPIHRTHPLVAQVNTIPLKLALAQAYLTIHISVRLSLHLRLIINVDWIQQNKLALTLTSMLTTNLPELHSGLAPLARKLIILW